jgi:transmembrane sensor
MASRQSRDIAYTTGVGEQRQVPLEDGTRLSLNSNSQVEINYSDATRLVRLVRGEAFFEVAHNSRRPFVVIAGSQKVTAIGTAFEVRYELGRVDVTLVEGKVSVSPSVASTSPIRTEGTVAARGVPGTTGQGAYIMAPGQRLIVSESTPARIDEPRLDAVTAWRRSEVMLDETTLADAVAEMNRYNKSRLVIDEPYIASLRVSGIFHTGDSEGFARTIADLYRLQMTEDASSIHLSSSTTKRLPSH